MFLTLTLISSKMDFPASNSMNLSELEEENFNNIH